VRQIFCLSLFLTLTYASVSEAKINVGSSGLNSIYGKDDREIITKKSDQRIQELSKSVALIVPVDVLEIGMFKTTIKAASLQETMQMCVSEHFVTRPAVSGCTGFLVAPNILASAGHCFVDESDCATKKIIFDVDSKEQSRKGYSVNSNDVFSCARIISTMYDMNAPSDQDYSLIELDRVPKRREPLKLNMSKKIDNTANVFMIGHPYGMPLILSRESALINNSGTYQFTAGLDSFEGNSGSPVINSKTMLVEGILVNGQEDLVYDPKNECYRNKVYDGKGGEGVFRASELPPFLK
jgi:V8-like Glu-specific endopeptidase